MDNIKINLKRPYINLKGIGWGDMEWIDLAQDRDQWRALVNILMNLRIS
jgi:hypothetical protein